jgi:hypothetical protein
VLLGLGPLQEEGVRRALRHRTVLHATGDHEQTPGAEVDVVMSAELDPEPAVPTEEQLVLVVVMPWELALEADHPHHGVVHGGQVAPLPRPREVRHGFLD